MSGSRKRAAFVPRLGAERMIAIGRIPLATVSLGVMLLDPTTPAEHPQGAFILLTSYLAYGLALVLLARRWPALLMRTRLVTHVVDLGVFAALMYLTEGPNSPFFLFFSLSLVAAAVRWQWRGVLWTAVLGLLVYDLSGLYAAVVLRASSFEADRFFVRTIYLAVLAAALGYQGWYESRLQAEMTALASWSVSPARGPRPAVAAMMDRTARIFESPLVILLWDEPEEPWSRLTIWRRSGLEDMRVAPARAAAMRGDLPKNADFIRGADSGTRPEDWVRDAEGVRKMAPIRLDPELEALLGPGPVLGLAVAGAHARARLFLSGARSFSPDDFVAGRIVAHRAAAVLDYVLLWRRLRLAVVREERVRLSRDLHDGLLQSLTGAALQLEATDALWDREPAEARRRLREIQRFITDEQRDLRLFIESLRPHPSIRRAGELNKTLVQLGDRIRTVWNLQVMWSLPDSDRFVTRRLRPHVYSLVREALANSARHGRATQARVMVSRNAGHLDVIVADNGSGFDFRGRLDHDQLEARDVGPVSLRNRLSALGGRMSIESGPNGARLEFRIPMETDVDNAADTSRSR